VAGHLLRASHPKATDWQDGKLETAPLEIQARRAF